MNWYVVYTKVKCEKKVAEQLNEIGITAYCPTIEKVKQWSDRKKVINIPLFNSYVFVQISEKDRDSIFAVSGVIRYLFWIGKPAKVKNSEIDIIKKWLSVTEPFKITVSDWKKGDKITIESGPFATQQATIQEVNQNHYVLILESMGCMLKIEKKEKN